MSKWTASLETAPTNWLFEESGGSTRVSGGRSESTNTNQVIDSNLKLKAYNNSASYCPSPLYSFTERTTGKIRFRFRTEDAAFSGILQLHAGTGVADESRCIVISPQPSDNRFYDWKNGILSDSTCAADTDYTIQIEFDSTANSNLGKYNITINGTTWSDLDFLYANAAGLDMVRFVGSKAAVNNYFYIDQIYCSWEGWTRGKILGQKYPGKFLGAAHSAIKKINSYGVWA